MVYFDMITGIAQNCVNYATFTGVQLLTSLWLTDVLKHIVSFQESSAASKMAMMRASSSRPMEKVGSLHALAPCVHAQLSNRSKSGLGN